MLGGDVLRDRRAHLRDPDREEPAVERKGPRGLDRLAHHGGVPAELAWRAVLADVEFRERGVVEREEVERVADNALLNEDVGDAPAERLYVERVAAREMLEAALELRGAAGVAASHGNLSVHALGRRAAHGADRREHVGRRALLALLLDDAVDRGDHVPGLHKPHMVADAYVLRGDLLGVVEGRAGDDAARQLDRLQLRDGRQHARAPDLHRYRAQDGLRALRRVFVRPRPARRMRSRAEGVV